MALNHHANHLFWRYQGTEVTGYGQTGSSTISFHLDPTDLLQPGTQVQLVQKHTDKPVAESEVKVVASRANNDWCIKLSSKYSLSGENGLQEVTVRLKTIPEIADLASRAYHCGCLRTFSRSFS